MGIPARRKNRLDDMIELTKTPYANKRAGTDRYPFQVITIVSDITLDVREMAAELSKDWRPEVDIGGFVGHCTNNYQQRWEITPAANGEVVRIRKHRDGKWRDADRNVYDLSEYPRRFHDYNF